MKNIQLETLLFFAQQVVTQIRTSTLKISVVAEIGKRLFNEVIEYLEENNEISKEELNLLQNYNITFKLLPQDIMPMDYILSDIKEGKSHWQKPDISALVILLENELITKEESIRYLAHHNYYKEVIEKCEETPSLIHLAKKYGSERTRINFKNYETMKLLESRLKPLGKKEKREKI